MNPQNQQSPSYFSSSGSPEFEIKPTVPTLYRRREGRIVGGVCGGIAMHLGVQTHTVRLVMAALSMLGGVGCLAYALVWLFTQFAPPEVEGAQGSSGRSSSDWMIAILAIVAGFASFAFLTGVGNNGLAPLALISCGAALLWVGYDQGFESFVSGFGSRKHAILSTIAGSGLLIGAAALILLNWRDDKVFSATVSAVLLTLVGVVILSAPVLIRLWDALTQEQAQKAAEAERTKIATRIHDSVLQTLALVQKRADDPTEVARLARGQERELRQWLFGSQDNLSTGARTVFGAIRLACGEVEDAFGITVTPVTVGSDHELNEKTQAIVFAAREAMVNAAKHSGENHVDVYAECLGGFEVYVRDRGVGFDVDRLDSEELADRHGVRNSIVERCEAVGAKVAVKSKPGAGTEVAFRLDEGV